MKKRLLFITMVLCAACMIGCGKSELPEGVEIPEDVEIPEGTTPPEGMEIPEGATPPEGMEIPEGAMPPEGAEMPEKGNMPPQGGNGMTSKAGIADAPLAIIVSCASGSELDAGLATQNMSVAAQLMGYGTKIISSPTMALNGEKQDEYRELLGIPAEYSAVAVLLVGYSKA